ncbi:hypothetical protein AAVH_11504 [Aphelenchoides avenae]|nr:hypothetical protein AAVH_11504 [Aphelenchus avenae]
MSIRGEENLPMLFRANSTVRAMKLVIVKQAQIDQADILLIYDGRVLDDNEEVHSFCYDGDDQVLVEFCAF